MLAATIFTLTGVGVAIAFGSTRYFTAMQNVGQVKSSVDDLTMERGTVSMRVAFVLRSAEVQPLFRDLCDGLMCKIKSVISRPWPILPPLLLAPLVQKAREPPTTHPQQPVLCACVGWRIPHLLFLTSPPLCGTDLINLVHPGS